MREPVIVGYLRTCQSRSRPNDPSRDWLHEYRADDLVSFLVPELLQRAGIQPEDIDDCITGCSIGVGENWTYGGRFPVFLSNLPETVAAKGIDQQCGSSMAAVHVCAMEIMTGCADVTMAIGMEHMTRVPMGQAWRPDGNAKANPRLVNEQAYEQWDIKNAVNMVFTAEKLFSQTDFTRKDLDEWAKRSHDLAVRAQKEGFFHDEIMPLNVNSGEGRTQKLSEDQSVRADTSLESLSKLRPISKEDGVITAGNSSPLNAGASAIILMSKESAKKRKLKPLATIKSIGIAGVEPTLMGLGPIPATQKALDGCGLKAKDIDYWEVNEAFAIVVLNFMKALNVDPEKVNIMGGGLALGHPLGATGCRLIGTLARILNWKKKRFGCANACVGGGQGVATIIERETYDW